MTGTQVKHKKYKKHRGIAECACQQGQVILPANQHETAYLQRNLTGGSQMWGKTDKNDKNAWSDEPP